jgi:hypothetical protein
VYLNSVKHFLLLIFVLTCLLFSCKQEEKKSAPTNQNSLNGDIIKNPNTLEGNNTQKLPEITFETLEHDFGKITEGDKVEYDFKFTNTGEAPLIISEVSASCGCTTPSWPKGVIKMNESDIIKVVYNSKGRPGTFSKGIVVTSNTYPNQTILKISGVVFKE